MIINKALIQFIYMIANVLQKKMENTILILITLVNPIIYLVMQSKYPVGPSAAKNKERSKAEMRRRSLI